MRNCLTGTGGASSTGTKCSLLLAAPPVIIYHDRTTQRGEGVRQGAGNKGEQSREEREGVDKTTVGRNNKERSVKKID